jgi:hypothetical protein
MALMVQLSFPETMARSKQEQKFWDYHLSHPEVYDMLLRFAMQWRDSQGDDAVVGIGLLWERVRWEVSINYDNETFKACNNHRAYYARLLMDRNPALDGIFRVKQQRIPASFGPCNTMLPSGDHRCEELA